MLNKFGNNQKEKEKTLGDGANGRRGEAMMKQFAGKTLGLACLTLVLGGILSACSAVSSTPIYVTSTTAATNVPTPSPTTQASTNTAPNLSPTATTVALAPQLKGITRNADQIGVYNKFELSIDLQASYTNPFDPNQIDLQATFTSPKGQSSTVPGFYWQGFDSHLAGDKEVLSATGQTGWKVRFSPTEPGVWTYFVKVASPIGKVQSPESKIQVISSTNPGYLRVSQRDSAYFEFNNGMPYFAVGQNVAWYGKGGTHDYERWFKAMSANGANFARIWMADWAMGIEWGDAPLGDYSKRQDRAWQLDRVFELAEQNNIYLMLSLLNHGAFSKTTNSEWEQNPYNAALGGPCAEPEDFATNLQARQFFKQRLRYMAARWGYSSHLMAWEWWNEIDFTPLSNRAILQPWLQEMTAALKSWEGLPHLKTTSYAHSVDEEVYKMPEIDFGQRHEYSAQDPIASFPPILQALENLGKPALYSEFGGMGEDTSSLDKFGLHLHTGQWASLMSKAAGTSMSWYWDNYIEPLNLYHLFTEPVSFLQGENLIAPHYQAVQLETGSDQFSALVLKSPRRVLGWVKANTYGYKELKNQYEEFLLHGLKGGTFTPTYPAISDATLKLDSLTSGVYKVEWWSTEGKGLLKTETQAAKNSVLVLPVPSFQQDLAFKLILQK